MVACCAAAYLLLDPLHVGVGGTTRVVADGVAYAPHLPMDMKAWGVDWYGFSVYKTWGPHMAALYGSHSAFQDLKVLPVACLFNI